MAVKYFLLFCAFVAGTNAQALTEIQQIQQLHQTGFDGVCLDCNSLRCLEYLRLCPNYAQRVQFQGPCEALNRLPAIVLQQQCVYQNEVREHGQVLRVGNVQCLCSNSQWQCTQLSANTVVKTLENDPKTTIFSNLLTLPEYSDIKEVLDDVDAAMTVFVPNDDAWLAFLADTGLDFVADADVIKAALLYHVATSGGYSARILSAAQGIVMADGETATLTREVLQGALGQFYYGALTIDESKILTADILASNAIIHIIDKVMTSGAVPPAALSLYAELSVLPNHDLFAGILDLNGYEATKAYLSDTTISATVFAPDNVALANLIAAAGLDPGSAFDVPQVSRILQYHIATVQILSGDIPQGATPVPTLAGINMVVERVGNLVTIDGTATVTRVDILASNGVIHEITPALAPAAAARNLAAELPLVPAHELYGQVLALPGYETLKNYLTTTPAATVFLPSSAALQNALALNNLNAATDVTAVLTIMTEHVIPGLSIDRSSLPQGITQVTNLAGNTVTVTVTGPVVQLTMGAQSAQVTLPQIPATNGFIHPINAVLL